MTMSEAEPEGTEEIVDQENVNAEEQHEDPKGHISKEAWIEKGRDADEWRSPEVFAERGRSIKVEQGLRTELSNLKNDFAQQISGLNTLHKVQLNSKILELTAKRDAAIDEADTPAANAFQNELDQTKKASEYAETVPAQQDKDPAIVAWESDNPWSADYKSPKTAYAQSRWNEYRVRPGITVDQALSLVDVDVAREFPVVNSRRKNAPAAEGSSGPGGKSRGSNQTPTMSDLTSEEARIWKLSGSMWKTEKDFLKSVANDRKGAE